jgi:hypothetical protein
VGVTGGACPYARAVRRAVGLVPVALLGVALVVSTLIGLHLSDTQSGDSQTIADRLGCVEIATSHPQSGVTKELCRYQGDTIVILGLGKGGHALYPPDLQDHVLIGSGGKPVVIGCSVRDDCVDIKRRLGGNLTSGPMLGLSITVG